MDSILQLMSRVIDLNYDVNILMQNVNGNKNISFIEGAERGLDYRDFDLEKEEDIVLFNKRKEAFKISNQLVQLLQELNEEDKKLLSDKLEALVIRSKSLYLKELANYQELIDLITRPEFSFEKNEGIKQKIIDTKEQYSRYYAAMIYYENMAAYLKPYSRSK